MRRLAFICMCAVYLACGLYWMATAGPDGGAPLRSDAEFHRCFTLTFEYHGEELTNLQSFVVERATNVTFTTPDDLITVVVRFCQTNPADFYRVRADGL